MILVLLAVAPWFFAGTPQQAESAASKAPAAVATKKLGEQPDKGAADSGANKKLPATVDPLAGQPAFEGQRSPGFSPIELEIERMADGRVRIKSVDPNGPYAGVVKENDVFDSMDDVPKVAH
jgi:hypothetical protein